MNRLSLLVVATLLVAGMPRAWAAPAVRHDVRQFEGATVHVVVAPPGSRVQPVAKRPGRTVSGFCREAGAIAAINGGYFNHSDGWPVSSVTVDGRAITRPRENRALLTNAQLKPYLPTIFDRRVEWRLLAGPAGEMWTIAPHAAQPPEGFRLVHALQAGPALLPAPALEPEAFISRNAAGTVTRDGIASATRSARSALGIASDGALLLVAAGGRGLTIPQLSRLMESMGAVSAMALDGGSSTALTWREGARLQTFVGSGKGQALVNSALLVLPAP